MPPRRKKKPDKDKTLTVAEFMGRGKKPSRAELVRRFLEKKSNRNFTLNLASSRIGRQSTYFDRSARLRSRFRNLPVRAMGAGAIILPQGMTPMLSGQVTYRYRLRSDPTTIITETDPLPRMLPMSPNFQQEALRVISRLINSPHDLIGIPTFSGLTQFPDTNRRPIPLQRVRLRQKLFEIDGIDPKVKWNVNNGQCVPDFFKHFAPDCDMFKYAKQATSSGDQDIDAIVGLGDYWKDPFDAICEEGWEEEGICLETIKDICYLNQLNYCFVDFDMEEIASKFDFPPSKIPTLYAVIKDGHIFPITESRLKQFIRTKINSRKGGNFDYEKQLKESKIQEFVVLEREPEKTTLAQVVDLMKKHGKQPRASNIKSDSMRGIKSCVIDNTFYTFMNEANRSLRNALEYHGKTYTGEEVTSVVSKLFKQYESQETERTKKTYYSEFNENTKSYFQREGIKNITHRGLTEMFSEVSEPFKNTTTFDIRKCHTSILKNPAERFCKFTMNDKWETFDKSYYKNYGELKAGFYHVETDDTWMLAKSKCYNRYVVERALECEYITLDDIKMQLIPKKFIPKDYFKKFIEEFVVEMLNEEYNLTLDTKEGKELYKSINNTLSGFLGRTNSNSIRKRLTTCFSETVDFVQKQQEGEIYNVHKIEDDDLTVYYSTLRFEKWLERNYLPVYLQVLGEQAVMLHDYIIKLTDGDVSKIVYRYCDSVTVIVDEDVSEHLSEEEGGLRQEESGPCSALPSCYRNVSLSDKEIATMTEHKPWEIHESIKSSMDVQEYIDCIKAQMSLLTCAFAGAGKSRIIDALSKAGFKLLLLTATNISARNIGGDTIHAKFAYKDSDNQLSASKVQKVIDEKYDAIIVDEVQWLQGCHLLRLIEIKDVMKVPVLGFGDFKQLGNIEDINYHHSPPMKELFGNRMTNELEWHDKCRLDWEFTNIIKGFREWQEDSEGHRNKVYEQFEKIGCCNFLELAEMAMNFVWTNKTRKRLNREINHIRYKKSGSFWQLPYGPEAGDEWRNLVVHKDMPVMVGRRSAESQYVDAKQSEYGFVVSWDETTIYIRIKDRIVDCPVERFHYEFVPCYAATVHKMTGETIEGDIAIHEWQKINENKWHYTGLTRVRSRKNVYTVI